MFLYLLAVAHALALERVDTALCNALFCVAPTATQLLFMLRAPAVYQRRREAASSLCRLPQNAWLVLWQEVPELVAGGWLPQLLVKATALEAVAVGGSSGRDYA